MCNRPMRINNKQGTTHNKMHKTKPCCDTLDLLDHPVSANKYLERVKCIEESVGK